MPNCRNCKKDFPNKIKIDGKVRVLNSRKFCLDCSPFKSGNRQPSLDGGVYRKKEKAIKKCENCSSILKPTSKKYCSRKCQIDNEYKIYIQKWLDGEVDGGKGNWGKVSSHIRRYLMEKHSNSCSVCGWSEINPFTKSIPLEVEHIDGNAMNHKEENLTLLCPNCHSLTATYRGANIGNGRGLSWTPSEKLKRF